MGSKIHKGANPFSEKGEVTTEAKMEATEVRARKGEFSDWGGINTTEAVRNDAAAIAEETGADADKVFRSLVKRYQPHDEDSDSMTRRGDSLSDDEADALLAQLFGGAEGGDRDDEGDL